jgi:hypothetical protein
VAGGSKLFVASLSGAYRVCRARLAGQWASAVASVRATSPNHASAGIALGIPHCAPS